MPCFAFAEIKQERLGADGFPADWKPVDFAIGKAIISGTVPKGLPRGVSVQVAVSGTAGVTPTLSPVTPAALEGLGTLKLGEGGEAPDVWQKMPRADAEAGLARATVRGVASPALREAWRRLLVSEAAPPPSNDKGVRPSWLAVRANALQSLGLFEASWSLWRGVPIGAVMDDALALGWVQAKLLAGQGQEGCALAKSKTVNGQTQGDWPVVMAVCQLVGTGPNAAAAGLSLQLVEPVLKAKNPPLFKILSAVQDGKPVTSLNSPQAMVDALGGAVLAGYPALVGPDIMPRMPDVALRRLMASDALPVDLRGRAAVALARQTSLLPDGVVAWQLVSSTAFNGVLPDAVVVAKGAKTISGTDVPTYVQAALRLGLVDDAAKLMPKWEVASGVNTAANAVQDRVRMQAMLAIAALQGKIDDRLWDSWMVAQALENQAGVRNAQRSLLVVEGLGIAVPARVWQQMRDRALPVSTLVDPAWQRLLAGAVRDQNIPASLGLISEAWVGQPPAGVVPVVMGASVEALRRAGMEDIARRVAVEAMLGIPSSHLIPLVSEQGGKGQIASDMQDSGQVLIGADAQKPVSATVPVTAPSMLPPPRVEAVRKPSVPAVIAPKKPVSPSMAK